jgi:hypothetical protein
VGYKGMEVLVTVSWLVATETTGCLRTRYFNIFRPKADSHIRFYDPSVATCHVL